MPRSSAPAGMDALSMRRLLAPFQRGAARRGPRCLSHTSLDPGPLHGPPSSYQLNDSMRTLTRCAWPNAWISRRTPPAWAIATHARANDQWSGYVYRRAIGGVCCLLSLPCCIATPMQSGAGTYVAAVENLPSRVPLVWQRPQRCQKMPLVSAILHGAWEGQAGTQSERLLCPQEHVPGSSLHVCPSESGIRTWDWRLVRKSRPVNCDAPSERSRSASSSDHALLSAPASRSSGDVTLSALRSRGHAHMQP
eukprot:scaffold398_cov305-Prasinococcus_capsulatus_cf.AAC.6